MSIDKNKKDYSKGKIYCIRNSVNDDIYIGSTCQTLSQRMALHRYDSIKPNRQNTRVYKQMSEHGRDKYFIELIEDYPCENIYQLQKREGQLIREMKPALNIKVPTRTSEEYKEEEKDRIQRYRQDYNQKNYQKHKTYREMNKEQNQEYSKAYREINREHILEKKRIYRENHREELREKARIYKQQNREEINRRRRKEYKHQLEI